MLSLAHASLAALGVAKNIQHRGMLDEDGLEGQIVARNLVRKDLKMPLHGLRVVLRSGLSDQGARKADARGAGLPFHQQWMRRLPVKTGFSEASGCWS